MARNIPAARVRSCTRTLRATSFEGVAPAPWHFLYFLPLPQGHGLFLPTLSEWAGAIFLLSSTSATKSISFRDGQQNENVVLPLWWVTEKSPEPITSMPIRTSMPPWRTICATRSMENITLLGSAILTKWLLVVNVPPPTPTFVAPIEGSCKSAVTFGEMALCVAPVS